MAGPQQEIDLAHIHWYSPEWIQTLPSKQLLTQEEAMDYFALSPFFDPLSNNNNLRVQRMVTDPFYGYAKAQFELPRYVSGFEYIVAHTSPPNLFVIHRREVAHKGKKDNVTGIWFILDGRIYPSPNVYDAMATRLKNAAFLVTSTFSSLAAAHPPSNPRAHSTWRSLPPDVPDQPQPSTGTAEIDASSKQADPTTTASSVEDQTPNIPLLNALTSTRSALADLQSMAQKPAPRIDPQDELKRIEEEIMGVAGPGGGPTSNAAGAAGPRSVRSASLAPTKGAGAEGRSMAGTPMFKILGPRTPGNLSAASPMLGGPSSYGP